MAIRVDALNGSKITEEFLAQTAALSCPHVLHVTVNNRRRIEPSPTLEDALSDLAHYRRLLTGLPTARLMLGAADWDRVADGGRVGIILGYQNANFVGERLELLELLHTLGVRVLQITHNAANCYGAGCGADTGDGLTELGREFVAACNDEGILVDCSHSADSTTIDVARVSRQPVLITHANPSAVWEHRRNRGDAALQAVAETGGVVGVTFLPALLADTDRPTLEDVVRHVAYVVDLVGAEHVGFGSDFTVNQRHDGRYAALDADAVVRVTGSWHYPIDGLGSLDRLADALRRSGLSGDTVEGVLGRNFERVFRAITSITEPQESTT